MYKKYKILIKYYIFVEKRRLERYFVNINKYFQRYRNHFEKLLGTQLIAARIYTYVFVSIGK